MAAIRRTGGVATYFWQGKLPDPREAEFAAALAKRRFRSIENAASEEVSVGWVTAGDPTGGSFGAEDLDAGTGAWLRCRIDRKALPRVWVAIHRAAAERSRGRRLSARERRELVDDLTSKLLPRVLPTVSFVDALLFRDRRAVLLLNTGKAVGERFARLFFETFALPLEQGNPLTFGRRTRLEGAVLAALEGAEPVRWPRHGGARTEPAGELEVGP